MAEIKYVDWDGLVYYDGKSKQYIDDKFDLAAKFGGTYNSIEEVPSPGLDTFNFIYKIANRFAVPPQSMDFVATCYNHEYAPGTIIIVVDEGNDIYRFDILFEATSEIPLTPDGELDLSNYYTKTEIDFKLESLNDTLEKMNTSLDDYATKEELNSSIQDIENKADKIHIHEEYALKTDIPTDYLTEESLQSKNYITFETLDQQQFVKETDLNNYAIKDHTHTFEEVTGTSLDDYATKEYVQEAIEGVFIIPDLSPYAKTEDVNRELNLIREDLTSKASESYVDEKVASIEIPEVPTKVSELENDAGYLTKHQDISGKADVDHTHTLSDITDYEATDLTGYATEEFVNKKIAEAELADKEADLEAYYTKSEVDALIPDVSEFITEVPTEYITEAELNEKGYLTEHQDLSEYAKKSDIPEYKEPDLSDYALKEEVPTKLSNLENDVKYITAEEIPETDLSNYYNKSETETLVNEAVDGISIPDTSNFITMEDVEAKGYLTDHQDISHLATKEELPDVSKFLTDIPSEYVTEEELNEKGYLTEHQDLSEYAKKTDIPSIEGLASETFVKNAIAEAELNDKEVDLTGYATKEDIAELASKVYVDEKVASIDIPTVPTKVSQLENDSSYLTSQDISHLATKEELPSVEGLASEEYVNNAIANINIPETSLTDYYTKSQTDEVINNAIDSLIIPEFNEEDYYNKQDVDNLIDELVTPESLAETLEEALQDVVSDEDLTEYAKKTDIPEINLDGYATQTWVQEQSYITDVSNKADVEHKHTLSDISDYITPDLSVYVTDAELKDAIDAVEHQIKTKTSELENDEGFLTEGTLPAFVKPDDITDFVTLAKVEEAGFIKSIPDEYITDSELTERNYVTEEALVERGFVTDVSDKADKDHSHSYNELTDLPTIPSIDGLATEHYVDEAITNINIPTVDTSSFVTKDAVDTLLTTKANDVPFTEDYRAGTVLGGFVADESLQGMTVVQILTKLLNLNLYIPPVTDLPEGTPDEAIEVITNKLPVYVIGESGEQVELSYNYMTMTPEEAKQDNQNDTYFYQIIDPQTNIAKESGYQISTIYQENDYLTIYIPKSITKFHVEEYSALAGDWSQPTWSLIENSNYTLEGYTAYTADPAYEVYSGIAVRIVIEE